MHQSGIAHYLPLLLITFLGILIFLLITSTAPFKQTFFSTLFSKPSSNAASSPITPTPSPTPASPTIAGCSVLPANNIWNTPVDTLPVDSRSVTYVNSIGPTKPLHPDFGTGTIGIPFDLVPGSASKVDVNFTYADESDPGPYPIPLNPTIEGGPNSTGDRHILLIDRDNCVLYELFSAYPGTPWTAGSGAIFNLRSNTLRQSGWTSADAAGLPIFPGLVRYEEIVSGSINHAIRFTVPQTQRAFIWPARHYASSITDPAFPPMGVRVRLKSSFDLSNFSSTNQIILRALKKYGMILGDNGSAWFISGVPDNRWNDNDLHQLTTLTGNNFEVVDSSSLMLDPNSGQVKTSQSTSTPTPTPSPTTTPTATPSTCIQRPACLDQTPACLLPEPSGGWCTPGDIDGNRVVNIFDYNILVGNFGKTGSGLQGDIDNNGVVNIFDYNILVTNFGKTG